MLHWLGAAGAGGEWTVFQVLLKPEMVAQINLSYAFIINDFLGFAGG
jgi:hypothetical protein